ncbi:MAG: hypothetical protein Q7W55_03300 [Pseudohongiella sp.]|nr:hypothetical protein [Pseudohongiella sp.]
MMFWRKFAPPALVLLVAVTVLAGLRPDNGLDISSIFITDAEVLAADATNFHASEIHNPDLPWRTIPLPRSWAADELHSRISEQAWYRIPLPAQAHDQGWNHLLILRHMMNLEIWLDGRYVGSAGPVDGRTLQRNWNRPMYWQIPQSWITQEPQTLYFRLHSAPQFGVMSPLILGTEEAVLDRYRLNRFLQIDLVKISLLALVFIALLGLFVWIKTAQQHWLLIAMMSASWSLPVLYILLPSVPMAEFNFLRLSHWGTVTGAFCLLAFIYSFYLKTPFTKLKWLGLLPVIHGVLLMLTPDINIVDVGSGGQLLAQILFMILIVQLLKRPELRRAEIYSIISGLLIMLLAAAHDVSLALSSSVERWRWDMFVSYITQPLMMIIIAWQGIRAYLHNTQELAGLNRTLQDRLHQAEADIRAVYNEQEQLEREMRIATERELVYRDLHDDLGARLLSLVLKTDRGQARDLARSALQDLRDIVSRVMSEEQSLSAVLADSMAEHESRAGVLKKLFLWQLDASLDGVHCSSRLMLDLRLLLRELIGNYLRQPEIQLIDFNARYLSNHMLQMSLSYKKSGASCTEPGPFPLPSLLLKRIKTVGAVYEQTSSAGVAGIHLSISLPCESRVEIAAL